MNFPPPPPDEIPVRRLWDVCKACPFQYVGISWGHDYGGIAFLESRYPWKDRDLGAVNDLHRQNHADPWNIPELQKLVQAVQLNSIALPKKWGVSLTPKDGPALDNSLTRLPLEVLGYIVIYLPTEDVRALAQVSNRLAMTIPSSLGQLFWASRFQYPFEFDFIFEARSFKHRMDWRSLYFQLLKATRSSDGLQNRKRIWGLIQSPLSELLCLQWKSEPTLSSLDENEKLNWKEAHGKLEPLETSPRISPLGTGCKRFHIQRTRIPTNVRKVVISTILIGNSTYLTGLSFTSSAGRGLHLGYTPKRKTPFIKTTAQLIGTTGLRGFILAIGSRGIQALQVVTCAGQISQWFGCSNNLPKTRRLISTSGSIAALEAGFDVSISFSSAHHIISNW
jgi:F-box domain